MVTPSRTVTTTSGDVVGVLDDDIPEERELGIRAGFMYREVAHLTAVYTDLGISGGMKLGIEHAEGVGRPIDYRTLPGWGRAA